MNQPGSCYFDKQTERRNVVFIDISAIPKAKLLAALHNGNSSVNWFTPEHAQRIIDGTEISPEMQHFGSPPHLSFDYLYGVPLKVDLSGAALDTRGYDSRSYPGHAEEVINKLRATL